MGNGNETGWARPPFKVFAEQTEYHRASRTSTARCAVCGNAVSHKREWFQPKGAVIQKLRSNFDRCDKCGKWVCDDCFCVDDGKGNDLNICAACCKEQGINGLTMEQVDEMRSDK